MQASSARTIGKERVGDWVGRLLAQADVIAPAPAHAGDVQFRRISSAAEVQWNSDNPLYPPKWLLLPQTDPLATIRRDGRGFAVEPIYDDRPRVLFAAHSCDVKGIDFLTRMQAADLPDAAYLRRAAKLTTVSVTCTTPCPLGFCICCDAGPFLAEGFDVQLTDLGDRFLAEAGSEKGDRLIEPSADLFRPAGDGDVAHRKELEEAAKRAFGSETCHFASAMRRVSTGRVSAELWEEIAGSCLECGACNFVCPTCYCFSVKDQRRDSHWVRCRTWDSCQYRAFTLEASGHNPREAHGQRVKRRFFHKVSAQYFRRDGAVGCVGCGRCVKVCLGTTDMPAVVAAIRKGAWHG
jgi:formate hydrogenlyase subunit 6/NADH:ubiquinone oxidoreductase subunit I